jgi:hypothetical protein
MLFLFFFSPQPYGGYFYFLSSIFVQDKIFAVEDEPGVFDLDKELEKLKGEHL